MRIIVAVLGLLLVLGGSQLSFAQGSGPLVTTEKFYDHLRNTDYVAAADMFDPAEVAEFRDLLRVVFDNPSETDIQQMQAMFGPDFTIEKIRAMSDAEFFSTFLRMIFQQLLATGAMSLDGVEILGSVADGDDQAHVVIRQTIGFGDNPVEMMDVVSLRRSGDEWKLIMKGDMKALGCSNTTIF